jgi:hypothetical protein
LWQLLRLYREGRIEPAPFAGLGLLPPRPSPGLRALHSLLDLVFGLRVADGTDRPLMVACSLLVKAGVVGTRPGASYLLREAERLGIAWCVGAMPKRHGRGYGTRLFLPGWRPIGPEPEGGWRVEPVLSEFPVFEFEPVGVEGPVRPQPQEEFGVETDMARAEADERLAVDLGRPAVDTARHGAPEVTSDAICDLGQGSGSSLGTSWTEGEMQALIDGDQ